MEYHEIGELCPGIITGYMSFDVKHNLRITDSDESTSNENNRYTFKAYYQ